MKIRFKNVYIDAIDSFFPENRITSLEIEERLEPLYTKFKLRPGRLELMTGIRERRLWPVSTKPSEVASLAAEKVLKKSSISPSTIGCLINASVCRDTLEPATANMVHSNLGLPENTMVFDISNACLGFINALLIAGNLIDTGVIKAALITAGENGAPLYEGTIRQALNDPELNRKSFKKYFASLTIGAGACACILTHSSISDTGIKLLGGYAANSTENCNLCVGDNDHGPVTSGNQLLMETDAEKLLVEGIELAKVTWKGFTDFTGFTKDDFKHFFCHQVGSIHRRKLYEGLDIPLEKDFSTFEYLGNVGSVSLPATFGIGLEQAAVKKGDKCALLGIGSGINCIMMAVEV